MWGRERGWTRRGMVAARTRVRKFEVAARWKRWAKRKGLPRWDEGGGVQARVGEKERKSVRRKER